ncbi:MAG: Type 1 glutamine amidotransferase-like domain-containing protein [Spirochaetales bacterium]|nr:Type 1 glutamine amidotransferase-like domain-containing protein [Spirochaetales bacterium]
MGPIILLSKSLSVERVQKKLEMIVHKNKVLKLAIIPTAHRELKSHSRGSREAYSFFHDKMKLQTSFVDLDEQPPLQDFDAYYFTGGDPVYLMNSIKERGYFNFFKEEFNKGKTFLGNSAGAAIFGTSLEHIPFFAPEYLHKDSPLPQTLSFINHTVLPHANNYSNEILSYNDKYPEYNLLSIRDGEYDLIES